MHKLKSSNTPRSLENTEQEILNLFISGEDQRAMQRAKEVGWLSDTGDPKKGDLEWFEFKKKCQKLGLRFPRK